MKTKNKGFTLIEILIAVSIIGVLAAVILVTLTKGKDGAKQRSAYSTLNSLKSSIGMCVLSESMNVACKGTPGALNSSYTCGGGPNAIPVEGTSICHNITTNLRSSITWPDISKTGYKYGAYYKSDIYSGAFAINIYKEGDDTIFCCTQYGCEEMEDTGSVKGVVCLNKAAS